MIDAPRTCLADVVINGRFLTQPITGVQRYGREVLNKLSERCDDLMVEVPGRGRMSAPMALDGSGEPWGGFRGHTWEQLTLPGSIADGELLVNLANFAPTAVEFQVVTIYDTAPRRAARHYGLSYRALVRMLHPRMASKAVRIVTISRSSRNEIIADLDLDPDRVVVIAPGVDAPFTEAQEAATTGDPYALFVGGHDPRKNLSFLVEIWDEVRSATGLGLTVVSRSESRPHRQTALPAGIGVVFDPTDEVLASLYVGAACLVSPSTYEGFGLPLLEAMATGTPFVSTPVGAAVELAVDRRLQVMNLKPIRWVAAIREVVAARDQLGAASRAKAAAYSWDAAAEKWAHVIEEVR